MIFKFMLSHTRVLPECWKCLYSFKFMLSHARVFGFVLPVVTSRFPTGDISRTLRVFENEENVNFYARMFVVFVQLGECDF